MNYPPLPKPIIERMTRADQMYFYDLRKQFCEEINKLIDVRASAEVASHNLALLVIGDDTGALIKEHTHG